MLRQVASDQMAMRRWNEQREVKLEALFSGFDSLFGFRVSG